MNLVMSSVEPRHEDGVGHATLQVVVRGEGANKYRHDGVGNLTAAIPPDGKVDLRMPDAVSTCVRRTLTAESSSG